MQDKWQKFQEKKNSIKKKLDREKKKKKKKFLYRRYHTEKCYKTLIKMHCFTNLSLKMIA